MGQRLAAGMLVAGLVVLAAVVVALSAVDGDGDPGAAAPADATPELRVGDCFDDPGALDPGDPVLPVPCDEPHDHEVFHTFEYEDAGTPPPEEAAIERTNDECIPAFEEFVGVPFEDSELGFFPLEPTRQQWRTGERTVRCALLTMDGSPLTGSARDAER